MSEKPFKENTNNPLMGEEPSPLRYKTVQAAIGKLQQELITFLKYMRKIRNWLFAILFGDLDFEQNVQLLHKHALHHLKQFGVEPLQS